MTDISTTKRPVRLLSFPELKDRYGISYSRTHLWKLIGEGQFPAPVQLNLAVGSHGSRKAWRESEIEAWLETRGLGEKRHDARDRGSQQQSTRGQ